MAGCGKIFGHPSKLICDHVKPHKGDEVLFFDEATSALDSDTEREITSSLEALSRFEGELTIFIIAHRTSSLTFCDRIVEIKS
jgi:ABC-type multidrug transport system fused ATPase/permease subunit